MTVQFSTTQHSTYRGFTVTWTDEETGEAVTGLNGATVAGKMLNADTGVSRTIDGVLSTISALGVSTWAPSANDVATAGTFEVQLTATLSLKPYKTFRANLLIEEAIV